MTCVVGIETEDGVLLGADSAVSSGWFVSSGMRKCARVNGHVLGFSGGVRFDNLATFALRLPPSPRTNLHRHVVMAVVPALRACLKEAGAPVVKEGAEDTGGATFLVGVGGKLFEIATDYSVLPATNGYLAIGCGREIACGSLATTEAIGGIFPRGRLRLALEAAERHSLGVRRPFRFLEEKGAGRGTTR